VVNTFELLMFGSEKWPPGDHLYPQFITAGDDLFGRLSLGYHSTYKDIARLADVTISQPIYVHIHQLDLPVFG
jgi:hypothetical protein